MRDKGFFSQPCAIDRAGFIGVQCIVFERIVSGFGSSSPLVTPSKHSEGCQILLPFCAPRRRVARRARRGCLNHCRIGSIKHKNQQTNTKNKNKPDTENKPRKGRDTAASIPSPTW